MAGTHKGFQQTVAYLLACLERSPDHAPLSDQPARLCRDFLRLLAAEEDSQQREKARKRLEDASREPALEKAAGLFLKGADAVMEEVEHFHELGGLLFDDGAPGASGSSDPFEALWRVFCPQAAGVRRKWDERVLELRDRRTIRIEAHCKDPIRQPAREILFTSNALLTVPPSGLEPSSLDLEDRLCSALARVMEEDQRYWYDHPVQMGVSPEKNEILYGLKGLSDMLRFEKERGNAAPEDRLQVALSASVTHHGLKDLAKTYIQGETSRAREIEGIDLHVFTEEDTNRILENVLCPAARHFDLEGRDPSFFSHVFGVDGPYGRHYSFLKAIAGLWHVAVNPDIRATFKVDLDQVFPQEQLVQETGHSAFDLMQTPLWGALGRDREERPVSLGMLAGALVNQDDIRKGIFTPDVKPPTGPPSEDRRIFASHIPQALSTEAEMMTRYGQGELNGTNGCLSRVHVTGGTVGIRVDSLRRYRPFTLSCIGRAEDQAYLMSVLFDSGSPSLRYVHAPGLIMRHDKHAFAGEAIKAAAAGKLVGDYERMLLFSHYAASLPWPLREIRSSLDPFTGCFILSLPFATALLSLAWKVLHLGENGKNASGVRGDVLLEQGADRLLPLINKARKDPDWIRRLYEEEKKAWNAFYDILNRLEQENRRGDKEAARLMEEARSIVRATRVKIG